MTQSTASCVERTHLFCLFLFVRTSQPLGKHTDRTLPLSLCVAIPQHPALLCNPELPRSRHGSRYVKTRNTELGSFIINGSQSPRAFQFFLPNSETWYMHTQTLIKTSPVHGSSNKAFFSCLLPGVLMTSEPKSPSCTFEQQPGWTMGS